MDECPRCWHPGCNELPYLELDDYGPEPNGATYCINHIPEGYCHGCGTFQAGSEWFDFSEVPGFCFDCILIMERESGWDDYTDDDEDGDD